MTTPPGDAAAPSPAAPATEDVDIGMLAAVGEATSRNIDNLQQRSESGHHMAQVPETAPSSPAPLAAKPRPQPIVPVVAVEKPPPITKAIVENTKGTAHTAAIAIAGAYAGAAAGAIIGGDVAALHLSEIARPHGKWAGRSAGRDVGAALRAAAIRCQSRSRSRSASVRFHTPDGTSTAGRIASRALTGLALSAR